MLLLPFPRLLLPCLCVVTVVFALFASITSGQEEQQTQIVPPKLFGFDLPDGHLGAGGDVVRLRDKAGKDTLGKVHVRVGDHVIVMLPDGELVARKRDEVRAVDALFSPESKDTLASRLTEGPLKGFQTRQTRRYLYVYNTTETFAVVASRILETMAPGIMQYAEAQKIDVREPDVPLVVVMYRNEAEYRRMTGAPEGMVAFYNAVDNRVSMYENSRLAYDRPDLAVQQALATIAHEGAHQILHNIGVQQRLSVWPMWLTEGLAEFFAPTSTDARLRWKGAGQVNDLRMFELEQYFKARPADSDGKLIEHTVGAARLTSTGYATSWALTHYLAKNQRASFHKYVREISQFGPLEGDLRVVRPGVIPGNRALFEKHFGNDYQAMEKRIVGHLNRLPYSDPFAASPHFIAMITVQVGRRTKRDANIFRTEALAQKWQQETLDSLEETVRETATLSVRRAANKLDAQRYAVAWVRGG